MDRQHYYESRNVGGAPFDPSLRQKLVCVIIGTMFLIIAAIAPIILFHIILGTEQAIAVVANAIAVGFIFFVLLIFTVVHSRSPENKGF